MVSICVPDRTSRPSKLYCKRCGWRRIIFETPSCEIPKPFRKSTRGLIWFSMLKVSTAGQGLTLDRFQFNLSVCRCKERHPGAQREERGGRREEREEKREEGSEKEEDLR